MDNFTLNAQDHIIEDILSHLKNGSMGQAVARKFNYNRVGNNLYFTLKPGEEVNLSELFWFGYLTNQ